MTDSKNQTTAQWTITHWTVIGFLLFRRDAILKVAASKSAFWIGFLFVIAAGFAREYDGEYLIAEPWHLVLPLAASLIGCGAMVVLIFLLLKCNRAKECSFAEVFRSFLNVYWMTAPLALVYGIPVERLFDPGGATRANLYLLGVVAVWRVLLMIRSTEVLCGTSRWRSTIIVLLFCDVLAMLALYYVPGPIFMIMGGVRLTESEMIMLQVRHFLILLCYGTILIWVIGFIAICCRERSIAFYRSEAPFATANPVVARTSWITAVVAIVFWIPFLFFTQPEQQRRWKCEQLIEKEQFVELGRLTAEIPHSNFPPHWDPPPRVGYGERKPLAFLVLHGLLEGEAAPWIVEAYREKVEPEASRIGWRAFSDDTTSNLTDSELKKFAEVMAQIKGGAKTARELLRSGLNIEGNLSKERLEIFKRIEEIAGDKREEETSTD